MYGWDEIGKTFQLYNDDFRNLVLGVSYVGFLGEGEGQAPAYQGTQPELPFSRLVPKAGWAWVGVPGTQAIRAADLVLERGGVMRTVDDDQSATAPGLNWNWVYWDSTAQCAMIMNPFGGSDNTMLRPWRGYRVWANTEDVTISLP